MQFAYELNVGQHYENPDRTIKASHIMVVPGEDPRYKAAEAGCSIRIMWNKAIGTPMGEFIGDSDE